MRFGRGGRARRRSHAGVVLFGAAGRIGSHPSQTGTIGTGGWHSWTTFGVSDLERPTAGFTVIRKTC